MASCQWLVIKHFCWLPKYCEYLNVSVSDLRIWIGIVRKLCSIPLQIMLLGKNTKFLSETFQGEDDKKDSLIVQEQSHTCWALATGHFVIEVPAFDKQQVFTFAVKGSRVCGTFKAGQFSSLWLPWCATSWERDMLCETTFKATVPLALPQTPTTYFALVPIPYFWKRSHFMRNLYECVANLS